MVGRLEGKVALVTGAARGQGRSHAMRMCAEGASVIATDFVGTVDTVPYALSNEADLVETAKLVSEAGGSIITAMADVRQQADLDAAVAAGLEEFGRLDIVVANAGVYSTAKSVEMGEAMWGQLIDINLSGVWRTCKAALPAIVEGGVGGAVVIISSTAGLKGSANSVHYTAAKHGVVGIMRTLAAEYAKYSIRVNTVHPTTVDTPMIQNEALYRLFLPGTDEPGRGDFAAVSATMHLLPTPWIDVEDVSSAVVFLSSGEARFITGATLPIDAGYLLR